jgi:uncharacterized protein YjbI with pentapeptide repeats
MVSCEQCWKDSGGDVDHYHELISVRQCSLEEQAGDDAEWCLQCNRQTIHQHTHECLNCNSRKNNLTIKDLLKSVKDWNERRAKGHKIDDLSHVNLSDANLKCTNLSGADLSGANLSRANLSRADLSRTNLRGTDLSGANLSHVNLSDADLRGASLEGALMCGATIDGAVLVKDHIGGPGHILYALTENESELIKSRRGK